MTRKTLLLPTLLLCVTGAMAQHEVVTPLTWNPTLTYHTEDASNENAAYKKRTTVLLPFFDDFSSSRIYPDRARWVERDVYVNSSYAIQPPSHGVATFDGLDQRGFPYNQDGQNEPRSCDTLTSQYIDLSGLSESDSIYISFYLQQKGIGDNPEPNDSFILEFKNGSNNWVHAWSTYGQRTKAGDFPFVQYIVRVHNQKHNLYFDSFQFRFRNHGNKTGALDHWHLDYVYLNKNRTHTDTIIRDVAIHLAPKGLFKNYYSMPFRHFNENTNFYLNKKIDYQVHNKDSLVQNPDIHYVITDVTNSQELYSSFELRRVLTQIQPFSRKSRAQDNKLPIQYFRSKGDPKVRLELKLNATSKNIVSGIELTRQNDEFKMYQSFDDFFAYDDGSAEGGYGLKNVREGAVALKFRVEVPDTLKYIAFHFTGGFEVLPDQKKFNIMVWDKVQNGEIERAKLSGVKPVYSDYLQGFVLYKLKQPLVISGDFFVGWHQFSEFNLNVGIDLDYRFFNDSLPNPNLWVNANGKWEQSKVVGTPMIRPVFADGVKLSVANPVEPHISIYPNPVVTNFNIQLDQSGYTASLYNVQGKEVSAQTTSGTGINIDATGLPKGLYILRIETNDGQMLTRKIIKQ